MPIYFIKKRFFAALKKHAQTSHSFLHCFAVWAKSLLYHVFVFSSHASLLSQGKKKSLHQTEDIDEREILGGFCLPLTKVAHLLLQQILSCSLGEKNQY